jgi:23S rRNA pseudouridine955/2504/2580 synthase
MKFTVYSSEKLIKSLIHNVQGLSFSSAQKMLRLGKVKVNNKRVKENIQLSPKDEVELYEFKKAKPNVEILYKDNNILIVNKPAGIECATRDKSSSNTYSLEEIFENMGAIVVHRLDRLTEGIVILARNKDTAKKFEVYFRTRQIDKFYKAGLNGIPSSEGIKTAYLRKNSNTALVEISDTQKDGFKEIITEYNIEKTFNDCCIVNIKLHTGRTHQIRGYFAHIGHFVLGDNKYGNKQQKTNHDGYYLTAYKVKFNLQDELKYLNDINIEITPTWIDEMK